MGHFGLGSLTIPGGGVKDKTAHTSKRRGTRVPSPLGCGSMFLISICKLLIKRKHRCSCVKKTFTGCSQVITLQIMVSTKQKKYSQMTK